VQERAYDYRTDTEPLLASEKEHACLGLKHQMTQTQEDQGNRALQVLAGAKAPSKSQPGSFKTEKEGWASGKKSRMSGGAAGSGAGGVRSWEFIPRVMGSQWGA
jgi:hypothetical protein